MTALSEAAVTGTVATLASPYMTTEEVAAYGRTTPETVRWWRHKHIGPPSFKVGRRVLYRRDDVEAFFAEAYQKQTANV